MAPACGPDDPVDDDDSTDDDDAAPDDDDSSPDDDDDSSSDDDDAVDDDDAADSCTSCTEPCGGAEAGCYGVAALGECAVESVPRGLFVLVHWSASGRIDPSLLDLPHIRGATVRSYWKDIETSQGVYDWSKLDDHFGWAMERGKTVRLAIGTGAYAPSWLIGEADDTTCSNDGDLATSDLGIETVCADVPNGEYGGEQRRFPLPWDAAFHTHWTTFLTALVDHLEETSTAAPTAAISALDWIAVTGPGGHNGEVSHPGPDWVNLGLTHPQTGSEIHSSESLLSALTFTWERALDDFDGFFGSRGVHYTVSYVYKSFPIGPGNMGDDALFKAALTEHGTQLASAAYFGVQSNGLDNRASWAHETTETWPTAKAHWGLLRNHDTGGESFTGMQSRGMVRLYDEDDSGTLEEDEITPCRRAEVWQVMISNAQCLQVDVVEIYSSDAAIPWDASCEGGVRAELERLAAWLSE
jgi:hypothetical protein